MPRRPQKVGNVEAPCTVELLGSVLRPLCGDMAVAYAAALLAEYETLAAILEAASKRARRASGIDRQIFEHLGVLRAFLIGSTKNSVNAKPVFSTSKQLLEYLFLDMAHTTTERFRALYLNGQKRLLRDEIVAYGSVTEVVAHPRAIIERALEVGAAALILVHNHPSGDATPSDADAAISRRIIAAGRPLDICVEDHIIISKCGWTSLRASALL